MISMQYTFFGFIMLHGKGKISLTVLIFFEIGWNKGF
jgi:hypothetical protein